MPTNKKPSYRLSEDDVMAISVLTGYFENAIKELIRRRQRHLPDQDSPSLAETVFFEELGSLERRDL